MYAPQFWGAEGGPGISPASHSRGQGDKLEQARLDFHNAIRGQHRLCTLVGPLVGSALHPAPQPRASDSRQTPGPHFESRLCGEPAGRHS